MNVVHSRPAAAARVRQNLLNEPLPSSGPTLDFYHNVPNFELGLDEFEEFALARLKVLRKIEELKIRNIAGVNFRQQLDETLKVNLKDHKTDVASHFILRAAYCRTEELRRWFLSQECILFRHRLESLPETTIQAFCKKFRLDHVPSSEKDRLRDALLSVPGVTLGEFATTPYYTIPFSQALDLVASRSCFLSHGLAYVPLSKVVSILLAKFRMSLSGSLTRASQAFAHVSEEGRIEPLLKTMNQQYTGQNRYNNDNSTACDEDVTAANIDRLVSSMPLCMSQLQAGMKNDHKLKYWGRMQYGLFLKGAGMSMEESLLFFQREFSRIMSPEAFHKQYSYNIRHMYGKEGKRASYTPYNCSKIIMGQAPQGGDHHGCPYKHYDEAHLASLLQKMNVGTSADRSVILDLKRKSQFQIACQKHFEVLHPNALALPDVSLDNVGNHPNAWFAASVAYNRRTTSAVKEEHTTMAPALMDVTS